MPSIFPIVFARTVRAAGLFFLGVFAVGILAACGGGGGNSGNITPPPPPPPPPPVVTNLGVSVVAQNTDCAGGSDCETRADRFRLDPEFRNAGNNYSPLEVIGAHYAYARGFTGKGVTVAVVDHGVDPDHPEFAGRLTLGFDGVIEGVFQDIDTYEDIDGGGHGTAVAGIIAAAKDNSSAVGARMHGVAYDSVVIPIRYLADRPRFPPDTNALRHGIDRAFVVNNSWGGEAVTVFHIPGIGEVAATRPEIQVNSNERAAFRTAAEKDRIVVFAAGNEGWNSETGIIQKIYRAGLPQTSENEILNQRAGVNLPGGFGLMPAEHPELQGHWLHVVAMQGNDIIAAFSNGCGAAKNWCLAAPGVHVVAPFNFNASDSGRGILHGTSVAAPFVSGAAAVLKSAFPNLGAKQVVTLLLITARDLGAPGVDEVYGHGMLDLEKATRPQTDPDCGGDGYQCPGLRLAAARSGGGDGLEIDDFRFADLRASRISPSAAFGDAFARTRAAAGFVDGFNRAYRAKISGLAGPSSAAFHGDPARMMRDDATTRERNLADGFFTRAAGDGAATALGWRGRVGGWRAALMESRNGNPGGAGVADLAFALGAARWRGAEAGRRDGVRFGFRAAEFSGTDSVMRQWFLRRRWDGGGWSVLPEFGILDEPDGMLGANFSGGFASGRSRTVYGKLNGATDLGLGLRGFAGAFFGRTKTGLGGVDGGGGGTNGRGGRGGRGGSGGSGGSVSDFSDLWSGGWEMGLVGERWRFSLWRPAGVLSGEMRMVGISGYDDAGKYRAAESRVDLSARHPHRLTFAAGDASGNFWWSAEKSLGGPTRFSVLGSKVF